MRTALLIILFLLFAAAAQAEPWQYKRVRNQPGAFIAGFLSGYAAHELGHIVAAESLGFDAEFDGVTLVYPEAQMTDAEHLQVASSGFQASWLISEGALRYRENRAMTEFGDSYNAGLVFSHLTIAAAYMTALMHHKDGDVEGIATATGASNEQIAAILAIPAILDGWRLLGKDVPPWVPTLSLGSKTVGLAVVWSW
jgi:hypothetical protein